MRCKKCRYPLWDLGARQCPECGAPFRPSEYTFGIGAVEFHCQHCAQVYYGTSQLGHLQPRSFRCVKCANSIDMDEMRLTPAPGAAADEVTPSEIPLLAIGKQRGFPAFRTTCWWAIAKPRRLGEGVPASGAVGPVTGFMLLTQLMASICPLFWLWLFMFGEILFGSGGPARIAFLGVLIPFAILALMGYVIMVAVWIPVWSLTAHVLLRMTGTTRGGPGLTYSSVCLSSGTGVMALVPLVALIAPVWWVVSAVLVLAEAQRVSLRRAAMAVAVPVMMVVAGFAGMASMAASGLPAPYGGGMTVTPPAASVSHAGDIARVIQVEVMTKLDGKMPDPIALLTDGKMRPEWLIGVGTATTTGNASLGGIPLRDVPYQSREQVREMRDRLARVPGPPRGAGELRLGDVVFTYSGAEERVPPADVWVAIVWPDSRINSVEDPHGEVWVLTKDGKATPHRVSDFGEVFKEQNVVRAQKGLKPLRHPRDVGRW